MLDGRSPEDDEDDVPLPPDQERRAPIEEPPDAPEGEPHAPVREPESTPDRRLHSVGA